MINTEGNKQFIFNDDFVYKHYVNITPNVCKYATYLLGTDVYCSLMHSTNIAIYYRKDDEKVQNRIRSNDLSTK